VRLLTGNAPEILLALFSETKNLKKKKHRTTRPTLRQRLSSTRFQMKMIPSLLLRQLKCLA